MRAGAADPVPWTEATALEQLPRRQLAWVAGSVAVATVLALTPLWAWQPSIALAVALGAGASLTDLRRFWLAPLVLAGVLAATIACLAIGWPAMIGAGAAAGGAAAWMMPQRTRTIDLIRGALGGAAGASIGWWAAAALVLATWPIVLQAVLTAAIVALVGAQGLLPVALRLDRTPPLPTHRSVQRALLVPYRPPALRALDLYASAQAGAPDPDTRRGMAEVASWVIRLQESLQSLDAELADIDPERVSARIAQSRDPQTADADPFVRDRRLATAGHLERLLEHRAAIAVERDRTAALVDYALAFLEEARAGVALAQPHAGDALPDRLPEVLDRLREHAREGELRRRSTRELADS